MFVPSFAAIGIFPSMLAVMSFRLDEYTGHGGPRSRSDEALGHDHVDSIDASVQS